MFKNYFKTAWRNLWKNKGFSMINIVGLAIGTTCCLYIVLYVKDQYSYDRHEIDDAQIYRLNTSINPKGEAHNTSTCSPPIAPAIKKDFPEVAEFARIIPGINEGKHLLTYRGKSIYETRAFYVDSTFFNLFTYHFIYGNPKNALTEPFSVVLIKTTAEKLFGREDPQGKVITMDDANGKHPFTITGVVDNSLGKSNIDANILLTMRSGGIGDYVLENNIWAGNNFTESFIKLKPGASAAGLEKKLPAFLQHYGAEQLKQTGMTKVLHLQPIRSIHTTSGLDHEMMKTVDPGFLDLLILIAVLIQVIACINFMNLSTARASKRAKEVGVRKVVGAGTRDLIRQFLGESFLLSAIGVVIALPLLLAALPYLNQVTAASIAPSLLADYRIWLLLFAIFGVTGIVAGSYPAFYLSAFQAINVVKGIFTSHISVAGIRRSLVVFQFVLSVVLISGVIVISSQLHYIQHKDLGFDKNQKLLFNFYTDESRGRIDAFMSDIRQLAEVKTASKSNNFLGEFVPHDYGLYPRGGSEVTAVDMTNISTDQYFARANGIKIIFGRDFQRYDSGRVLVNETALRRLGIKPSEAPGMKLYGHYPPEPEFHVEIVGVMKDFNYNSLHDGIRPFMLVYNPGNDLSKVVVDVSSTDYKSLLGNMENIWHQDLRGVPFEYGFLDEHVQQQYSAEVTLSRIINLFTMMAIAISCLGLFGLAAFSAEQRRKEIGVRKVLGASIAGIVRLLSKEFLKLVMVSIVISLPIAWWAMHQWLQGFTYRVDLGWWMFALAGLTALFIALMTVSFQAVKAATVNPVKSLRTD